MPLEPQAHQGDLTNLPFQEGQFDNVVLERDLIFILFVYSLVYLHWQPDGPDDERRGFNIGVILVDSQNRIAAWDFNSVLSTQDSTQHGEVRVIQKFLHATKQFSLKGYRIYSTLEPCIMCGSMMILTSLHEIVYGQKDLLYGDGIQRLLFDSSSINGFQPYPRSVLVRPAISTIRNRLEQAFSANPETRVTKWLASEEARLIYQNAYNEFKCYKHVYPVNKDLYLSCGALLSKIEGSPNAGDA